MGVVSVVWCRAQGTLTTTSVVVQLDLIAIGGMEKDVKEEYVPWKLIIAENNNIYYMHAQQFKYCSFIRFVW